MSPRRPSPAEPVTELRRIPIRECGEPLVDYVKECLNLLPAEPVYDYVRATWVRRSVAEMLNRACDRLPTGLRLGIIEGWRPIYIQRRMWLTSWLRFKRLHPDWSDHQLKRICNRYVAPPDAVVPPPHSTGGAVDLMLVDDRGGRLDHHTPYRLADPKTYAAEVAGLSAVAERNRAILREVMVDAGMTNYPSEWWHWSYGDQGWAYRGPQREDGLDRSAAIYGPILSPEGWTPAEADDTEEPLRRLVGGDAESGFTRVDE